MAPVNVRVGVAAVAIAMSTMSLLGPSASAAPSLPAAVAPAVSLPISPPDNPNAPAPVRLKADWVSPGKGTYGTGIILQVNFNRPVPQKARKQLVENLVVTSTKPLGAAGWAWQSDRVVLFRPKAFWPAQSDITVKGNLAGLDLGTVKVNGETRELIGAKNFSREFSIGRSQVININGKSHWSSVVRDGKTIRKMPISLGKKGWETRSGIKVLQDAHRVIRMTSRSIGAPEFYETDVKYAVRLTTTGEFIHAAPWAYSRLGRVNGSHGCTNLSTADARWVFNNYLIGDPVITTGTNRGMTSWNGMGGPWNVSWKNWSAGKAYS